MFNRSHVKTVFDELDELELLGDNGTDDGKADEPGGDAGGDSGRAPAATEAADTVAKPTATEAAAAPDAKVAETKVAETKVEAAADSEDAEADQEEPDSRSGRWARVRRPLLVATVGAVLVAALGAAGYFGWQYKQLTDTAAAGRTALAVARNYAVTLTTVQSKDIDNNFTAVLDGATGEFKDLYSQSATQLRQILIDNKAEASGTVIDAAVKSATKTKVDVLLFVDQSVTNSLNPTPRIDRNRVTITMELVDNRWLASKVDVN